MNLHVTKADLLRHRETFAALPPDWASFEFTRAECLADIDAQLELLALTGAPNVHQAMETVKRWKNQRVKN